MMERVMRSEYLFRLLHPAAPCTPNSIESLDFAVQCAASCDTVLHGAALYRGVDPEVDDAAAR